MLPRSRPISHTEYACSRARGPVFGVRAISSPQKCNVSNKTKTERSITSLLPLNGNRIPSLEARSFIVTNNLGTNKGSRCRDDLERRSFRDVIPRGRIVVITINYRQSRLPLESEHASENSRALARLNRSCGWRKGGVRFYERTEV